MRPLAALLLLLAVSCSEPKHAPPPADNLTAAQARTDKALADTQRELCDLEKKMDELGRLLGVPPPTGRKVPCP